MGSNSIVLWRGKSRFDGSPIRVVVTRKNTNRKLASDWVQLWILPENVSPQAASQNDGEHGVCGGCPLQGGRGCYVLRWQGPDSVWRATNGKPADLARGLKAIGASKVLRSAAYGDSAAMPVELWAAIEASAKRIIGYTHAWETSPHLRVTHMASVQGVDETCVAWSKGWRTFRATRQPSPKEKSCPGSCAKCQLCRGAKLAKVQSITIAPHGAMKGKVA